MTEKDRFPFPDQVEDRFHGNDPSEIRFHGASKDRQDFCPVIDFLG